MNIVSFLVLAIAVFFTIIVATNWQQSSILQFAYLFYLMGLFIDDKTLIGSFIILSSTYFVSTNLQELIIPNNFEYLELSKYIFFIGLFYLEKFFQIFFKEPLEDGHKIFQKNKEESNLKKKVLKDAKNKKEKVMKNRKNNLKETKRSQRTKK